MPASAYTYLILVGIALYCAGVAGLVSQKRGLVFFMLCLELALLGLITCFGTLSHAMGAPWGQVYALLILTAAAAESAVALALLISYHRSGGPAILARARRLRG